MGYRSSRLIDEALSNSVEMEELDLPNGEFIGKMGKSYKIFLSISSLLGIILGLIIWKSLETVWLGILFLSLGIVVLIFLPTVFSYRCLVNRELMREEYLVVFIKIINQAIWSDIKYKKIKKDTNGSVSEIRFYDADKKKMIAFDSMMVGFSRIVKMAKKGSIKELEK